MPPLTAENQEKANAFRLARESGIVGIWFFPVYPNVVVPPAYKATTQLKLNFNHAEGAGDLYADQRGITETLFFSGKPFACHVPWDSIFGITEELTAVERYRLPAHVSFAKAPPVVAEVSQGKRDWKPVVLPGEDKVVSIDNELAALRRRNAFYIVRDEPDEPDEPESDK